MAGLTLAQARTLVAGHLDDASNDRWSSAEIDIALSIALSTCLSDYAANGGEEFNAEASVTTSATDGTVALTSQAPLSIISVQHAASTSVFYPVQPITKGDRVMLDLVARDLVVVYAPDFTLPTVTSSPLVGIATATANTWMGFDSLVCVRAAMQLQIKDAEVSQGLVRLAQEQERSVMLRPKKPSVRMMPAAQSSGLDYLRWAYNPSTRTLQVCRSARW